MLEKCHMRLLNPGQFIILPFIILRYPAAFDYYPPYSAGVAGAIVILIGVADVRTLNTDLPN